MELFRLFGSILIDDKNAIETLKKTDKKASTTAEKFKKMAGTAAKVGTAVVGIGTAAATGLSALAVKTAESTSRIDDMSQKLGMSRQAFQEWDYIMGQTGMNIDSAGAGFKTLINQFDELGKGGKVATDAFGALGLSYKDLQGLSREEIFEKTLTALQGVKDEAKRAAIANDLFGRAGAELGPLLNTSAEEIEEMRKQAHELGMVLSDDAVKSGEAFGDTLDTVQRSFTGVFNQLGTALMPVLQEALDFVIDNIPMIQGLLKRFTPIISDVFSKLLPPLMDLASTLLPPIMELLEEIMPVLGELMHSLMPVIIDLLNMLMPPIVQIVKMILPLLLRVLEPLLPLLQPILHLLQPFIDLLMMILEPLVELLDMILPPLAELLAKFFEWYIPKLSGAFSKLGEIIGGAVRSAFDKIKPIIQAIKDIFSNLISFFKNVFTGNWKGAWKNIIGIFKGYWEYMKAIFKAPINWIIDGINAFTGALSKIKIPDWVPLVGGKGFNIPKIPHLEVGLDYVPYDNFPAILHKGERVLTAEENRAGIGGNTYIYNITIDAKNVKEFNDIIEIAESAKHFQRLAYGTTGG